MPNDQIHVALKPPSGTLGWQMAVDGGGWTTGPNYTPITVADQHKADITFTIQNGAGQSAEFAGVPILLPAKDKVFDPPKMNNTTSFTITDKNPDVDHQIPYVLVFKGNVPKLDPIIDNDGGGHLVSGVASSIDPLSAGFVGLVVGLILALVARALFSKRA